MQKRQEQHPPTVPGLAVGAIDVCRGRQPYAWWYSCSARATCLRCSCIPWSPPSRCAAGMESQQAQHPRPRQRRQERPQPNGPKSVGAAGSAAARPLPVSLCPSLDGQASSISRRSLIGDHLARIFNLDQHEHPFRDPEPLPALDGPPERRPSASCLSEGEAGERKQEAHYRKMIDTVGKGDGVGQLIGQHRGNQ